MCFRYCNNRLLLAEFNRYMNLIVDMVYCSHCNKHCFMYKGDINWYPSCIQYLIIVADLLFCHTVCNHRILYRNRLVEGFHHKGKLLGHMQSFKSQACLLRSTLCSNRLCHLFSYLENRNPKDIPFYHQIIDDISYILHSNHFSKLFL